MPSPVSNGTYTQLGIGDCGHVVNAWPLLTDFAGGNKRVFCDDCTRERYGIHSDEFVTVLLVERKPEPRPKGLPRKRAKKPVKPNPFQEMLARSEFFDGA